MGGPREPAPQPHGGRPSLARWLSGAAVGVSVALLAVAALRASRCQSTAGRARGPVRGEPRGAVAPPIPIYPNAEIRHVACPTRAYPYAFSLHLTTRDPVERVEAYYRRVARRYRIVWERLEPTPSRRVILVAGVRGRSRFSVEIWHGRMRGADWTVVPVPSSEGAPTHIALGVGCASGPPSPAAAAKQ